MAKITTIALTGASGQTYEFNVYPRSDTFKAVGGIYFMTKRTVGPDGRGNHKFIYVGETGDLSSRPLNHHRTACFDRNGADCLLIRGESDRQRRLDIETDLREAYDPPCNRQ